MGQLFSEPVRAWVYRVSLFVIPLLIFYGVLDEQEAALWAALLAGMLNQGLAVANTSTKT